MPPFLGTACGGRNGIDRWRYATRSHDRPDEQRSEHHLSRTELRRRLPDPACPSPKSTPSQHTTRSRSNDAHFSRKTGVAMEKMNNYGCSLIWGHPQAPTGVRSLAEFVEELTLRGGGIGLFTGCAAGDSAGAVVIRVRD
ncbi:hypothetical protein [Rhodococcus koreensis]|uniref:hypothetical protein n=1 Tax=Rhodococcus koreensis TaxID=99653 RepID=UPI00366F810C